MRPDFQTIDDITRRLAESVPGELKTARADLERQFRSVLENAFNRLDLVTREEFEIQKKVLLRTREKLERMEKLFEDKQQGKPAPE
jgi:BMFP domain-containing protein YqiC